MTSKGPVERECEESIHGSAPIGLGSLVQILHVLRSLEEVLKETAQVNDELNVDTLQNLVLLVQLKLSKSLIDVLFKQVLKLFYLSSTKDGVCWLCR